jgi:hypothetical protein
MDTGLVRIRKSNCLSEEHLSRTPVPYRRVTPMAFTIQNGHLILPKGVEVSLLFPIKAAHEISGVIIVVLDVPPKQYLTENVFGLSENGQTIWQIERIAENATDRENCYVGLIERNDESIIACNWNGTAAIVDVKTGRVQSTYITK